MCKGVHLFFPAFFMSKGVTLVDQTWGLLVMAVDYSIARNEMFHACQRITGLCPPPNKSACCIDLVRSEVYVLFRQTPNVMHWDIAQQDCDKQGRKLWCEKSPDLAQAIRQAARPSPLSGPMLQCRSSLNQSIAPSVSSWMTSSLAAAAWLNPVPDKSDTGKLTVDRKSPTSMGQVWRSCYAPDQAWWLCAPELAGRCRFGAVLKRAQHKYSNTTAECRWAPSLLSIGSRYCGIHARSDLQ